MGKSHIVLKPDSENILSFNKNDKISFLIYYQLLGGDSRNFIVPGSLMISKVGKPIDIFDYYEEEVKDKHKKTTEVVPTFRATIVTIKAKEMEQETMDSILISQAIAEDWFKQNKAEILRTKGLYKG